MEYIDLNCDMGEGIGNEALLLPFISSANIACGGHAGNAEEMKRVVLLCIKHHVAIGAHPSFPDSANFGRTEMNLPNEDVYELVKQQIKALHAITIAAGATLHHVKPHGALYNMAAKDATLSNALARAVKAVDDKLFFYGLSGSVMIAEAGKLGLRTANEVFADRTYQPDGTLTPRTNPHALITKTTSAIQQVMQMINNKTVTATNGQTISIKADTICIHGDGEHAIEFATALNKSLQNAAINIKKIMR
jgi:5-oxoprolinase (ATP-hydrolysing) subunit A